jgi:phage terminase large subunit-like protein
VLDEHLNDLSQPRRRRKGSTMSNKILDLVAAHDYLAFVQLSHMILRNCRLDESRYLEYSCHLAEEFAQGRRKRLIVNMPPGFAKTTIFSICGIAWLFAKDPALRIMLVTHDMSLARDVTSAVRKIMKSPEYLRIFSTRIEKGYDTVDDFRTTGGGRLFASSIESGITGRRADVIFIDDPFAIKYADKIKRVRKVNRIYDKEIVTRLAHPEQSRIILVMHRLHAEDLTAHLMTLGGYDRIALPLIAERPKRYEYGGLVWDRPAGEQLRPGLYSAKRIRQLKEEDGQPGFRNLYQQAMGPEIDFSIKPKHFPLLDIGKLPSSLPIIFSIDTSQKVGPDTSWNVILVVARLGNTDVVIDEFCMRCDYVKLYSVFHALASKYGPSAVLIEDTSNGSALISQLQDEQQYRVESVTPKGSKTKRLRRHLRRIRRGLLCLPRGAAWFGAFVGEFVDFPDGATDRIDAVTQYFDFMKTKPKLVPPLKRRERSGPVGVGSRGLLRPVSSRPTMEAPHAVLVTGSSTLRGPPASRNRLSSGTRPEASRDPITVVVATANDPVRVKI